MRVLDLFAGCGGMSLGFQNAGYDLVAAYDKWEKAVDVYRANFEHPVYQMNLDVDEYSFLKQHQIDMVIGGPPCQDFSSAGKRDETQGRADLTHTFAEMIVYLQPAWFVMENVSRIKKSHVLKTAKHLLEDNKYGLTQAVINASRCGVPQNRKRYFLIGQLNGSHNALLPYLKKNLSARKMTMHDYFGDSLGIAYYYRHPRSYQRRGVFSIHEPSPTIRGVNRPVPPAYQRHKNDAGPVDDKLRALTTRERSLVQTFPDDFILEGTKTNLEQMIGNAVPVKQAEYIATCILEYQKDAANSDVIRRAEQLKLL
jgi:DNA (cytosine-5)-methyltransferase 1